MTVRGSTVIAEVLSDFFKKLVKKGLILSKRMAKNVLKKPRRALHVTANVSGAAASRNPTAALSTIPEVINFYHTGRKLYLVKFEYLMLEKWNKSSKAIPICTIRKH